MGAWRECAWITREGLMRGCVDGDGRARKKSINGDGVGTVMSLRTVR